MNYYLNIANELQKVLPLIGNFIIQVDKFLLKANLLED
jgi:hypothetical protein